VSGARSKTKLWEDDTAAGLVKSLKGKGVVMSVENKKPGGKGLAVERTKITFGSDSEGEEGGRSDSDEEYDDIDTIPAAKEGKEVRDTGVSDMDYLKSKVGNFSDDEGDDSEEEEEEKGAKAKPTKKSTKMDVESEEEEEEEEEEDIGISGDEKEKGDEVDLDDILSGKKDETSAGGSGANKARDDIDGDSDEEVGESGRLFVRNLPYNCGEEELIAMCKQHGPVAEAHIMIDRTTKKSKGMAYVLYMVPEHAVKAMDALDGSIFQGRLIHVLPARSKKVFKKDEGAAGYLSSYKASKEAKRKEDAASDHNWNTLFLQQDAVVDAMTEEYGVEKSEILDPTASSMAVRVALGETRAIADTKAFLDENGVSVDAFLADGAKLAARSKTVILVKNIPSVASEEELRGLFTRHGSVSRVVMPPSKVMALVEFFEPSEARAAFRGLAYRPFKHTPLYLEWAPGTAFKGVVEKEAKKEKKDKKKEKATGEEEAPAAGGDHGKEDDLADEEGVGDGSATIYVTNLNFETTTDTLKTFFQKKLKKKGNEHGVRSATVATKKNPKAGGADLSRGYGFVEFATKEAAHRALKELGADTTLDGHKLKMKLSTRASASAPGAAREKKEGGGTGVPKLTKGKSATKIVVRNVPFEANKKEMTSLFHTFGQVKSVRMPKKFDGSHRGFAFVEFLTREEAKVAVAALAATHLYGRHLVIEYAAEDQSIEAIQAKAKRDLTADSKHEGGKLKKKKMAGEDEFGDFE